MDQLIIKFNKKMHTQLLPLFQISETPMEGGDKDDGSGGGGGGCDKGGGSGSFCGHGRSCSGWDGYSAVVSVFVSREATGT